MRLLTAGLFTLLFSVFAAAQCPLTPFQSLTASEKAKFWQERFDTVIAQGDLSPAQVDHLLVLRDFASEGVYVWASAGLEGTLVGERAYELEKGTRNLFTRKQMRGIFAVPAQKTQIYMIPQCNCSIGSYFNMSCEAVCRANNSNCARLLDGCGFLGLYACDAYCVES